MKASLSNRSNFAASPLAACLAVALATTLPSLVHADPQLRVSSFGQRIAPSQHRARMHAHHAPAAKSVPIRPAITTPVTNCDDDGSAGSLRSVVGAAADGDTIDLSALTCSTITLTQGAIAAGVDNITLVGPADSTLVIDGNQNDYVVQHTGTGTITVEHLTLSNGYGYYVGGGINSSGDVTLDHATISNNTAFYQGAGVCADGVVTVNNSTISGNATLAGGGSYDLAGGVLGGTGLTLNNSTVMNNSAYVGAGAYSFGPVTVSNSTISGNTATAVGGGLMTNQSASLRNSTIAVNSADNYGAGGIFLGPDGSLDLQSTIVASNTGGTTYAADIGGADSSITISGDHNLIMVSDLPTPADTITDDPLLQTLADNGGPTWTLALGDGSPAIDAGSNPDNLDFDQRGSGFDRVSGAAADIGAFEVQGTDDDTIFKDGFDGS